MKKFRKRLMAFALAAGICIPGGLAPTAEAAVEGLPVTVVHYDMSRTEDGKYLKDTTGKDNNGLLHNIQEEDFAKQGEDDVLYLPGGEGGENGAYIDLPASITADLNYKEGFSIEIALTPRTNQYQFLWTIGTDYQTNYLFFNPRLQEGNMNVAIKTDTTENSISGSGGVTLNTKRVSVVTVTSEKQELKLYVNGSYIGELNHEHDLDKLFKGSNGVLGYIGRSNWDDPSCDAVVTDFKIYGDALTAQQVEDVYKEVKDQYVYPAQLLEEDMEATDLGDLSAVTSDIVLPDTGENGSTITWTSDNTSVIEIADNTAKITRPEITTLVTLTAEYSLSGQTGTRMFLVNVPGTKDKAERIVEESLNLPWYLTERNVLPMSIQNTDITWTSDSDLVDAGTGKITAPASGMEEVRLTASVEQEGAEPVVREFRVKILGADSAYILGYTRETDSTRTLSGMYDEEVCYSMHLGYSEDGEDYEALLNNTGILFAKADGEKTVLLKDPYIFRMKDGTFGILAVRLQLTNADGKKTLTEDAPGKLLFFTSKDLVSYEEQTMLQVGTDNEQIAEPACEYDAVKDSYRITWKDTNSGMTYANTTKDFQNFSGKKVSASLSRDASDSGITYAVEGNVIGVTAEEADYIHTKLTKVVNTTVDAPSDITVEKGGSADLSDVKVTAHYSDGSSAQKAVIWDEASLAEVDFDKPGTYTVNGIVKQISDTEENNYPFLVARADPQAVEYNGKYYFIATTEDTGNIGIYIRESDTVTGLNDAQEHLIFDEKKGADYGYITKNNHWAPELHVVNGELYIFFSSNVLEDGWDVQSMVMKLTGDDPTDYDDWGELERFLDKDGNLLNTVYGGITLDMTYFTYGGRSYVAWSQRNFGTNGGTADIWLGETDADKPYQLISDAVKIVNCEYGWERNNTFVTEGPNVIIRDDKLYLTYSGGATDDTYCVGMTSIDLGADTDFLDPDAWTKSNYPILTGLSVPGYNGPGHNAYVTDEDGNLINVFHARPGDNPWAYRDAFLRIVHFGADGEPVLDMTEEREILPENKNVSVKIIVTETSGGSIGEGEDPEGGKKPGTTTGDGNNSDNGADDGKGGSTNTTAGGKGGAPQTGDTTNLTPALLLMTAAVLAAGGAAVYRRRVKKADSRRK